MTTKALMYAAQQLLQATTGIAFKRSHIYELIAATFGFNSHAAFIAEQSLIYDADFVQQKPAITPELIDRLHSLRYPLEENQTIATRLVEFVANRGVTYISLRDLIKSMSFSEIEIDDEDSDEDDWLDNDDQPSHDIEFARIEDIRASYRASRLLEDSLLTMTEAVPGEAHLALAMMNRCQLPNSYLYDESLKGRHLTKIEQEWVNQFLQLKPRFEKYEHHLRLSAASGCRQAAAEYAEVFDDRSYFELAKQGVGNVDSLKMARLAETFQDEESRLLWLRTAAEEGSLSAIRDLAYSGDYWAQRQLAESGDMEAIALLAEQMAATDIEESWMWAHLSKMLGVDLSKSTLQAYHDGGMYDGQVYDDDCGGPLYVAGDEGLELPQASPEQDSRAKLKAKALFHRIDNLTE